MIADGNPGETRTINKVGLERHGVSEEAQNALRQAYKILFREGLTVPNALAKIETGTAAAAGSSTSRPVRPRQRTRHQQVSQFPSLQSDVSSRLLNPWSGSTEF